MEDKTGIFTSLTAIKEETEDRREEDALASIFGKKDADIDATEQIDFEKTAVMDKLPQGKPLSEAYAPVPALEFDEGEDNEDEGQPFFVENTVFEKSKKKRKNDLIRQQKIRRLKEKQSQKTFAYIFGGIFLVAFIISVSAYFSFFIIRAALDFTGITTNEFAIEVEIPPDALTDEIAEILYDKGLIRSPGFFVLYSQLFGHDGKYLDGFFMLDSSMSYSALVSTMQFSGYERQTVMVTIPEGFTAEEIGLLLEENFVCLAVDFEQFYKNKQNVFSFERRVLNNSMKFHQLEGYLYPETYEFFEIDELRDGVDIDSLSESEREKIAAAAKSAANKMLDQFNTVITPEMYKQMNEKGFTLDELMTLASMVQAEAADVESMRYVASVFINRINHSDAFPRLESDPTGYYANNFIKPHVTQRNLSLYQGVMEAYDTYITPGIPPGPICNPGIDAIMAILEAPPSNYFYFCANIDTREVYFAETGAQHEANLAMVEIQRGASPQVD